MEASHTGRQAAAAPGPLARQTAMRDPHHPAASVADAAQRAPRPNSTTSTVWIRINRSSSKLWFFT